MLEVERKFLLRDVPFVFPPGMNVQKLHILQRYLVPDSPFTAERVRVTVTTADGSARYFHTKKRHISAGVNEELEEEIDVMQFRALVQHLDPALRAVVKRRDVFEWGGFTFELDTFDGALNQEPGRPVQVLEVELPSLSTFVQLPPWLEVEREVTEEPRFSNRYIAEHGLRVIR